MSLLLVHDAGLDLAKAVEDVAEFIFGATGYGWLAVFNLDDTGQSAPHDGRWRRLTLHRPQTESGCRP
jgi:hypothetical protein